MSPPLKYLTFKCKNYDNSNIWMPPGINPSLVDNGASFDTQETPWGVQVAEIS